MKSKCPTSGKVQFLTENTALIWMNNQNRMKKRKGFKPLTNVYKCRHCNLWHTTTQRAKG